MTRQPGQRLRMKAPMKKTSRIPGKRSPRSEAVQPRIQQGVPKTLNGPQAEIRRLVDDADRRCVSPQIPEPNGHQGEPAISEAPEYPFGELENAESRVEALLVLCRDRLTLQTEVNPELTGAAGVGLLLLIDDSMKELRRRHAEADKYYFFKRKTPGNPGQE